MFQVAHELRNHGAGGSQPGQLQVAVFQAEVKEKKASKDDLEKAVEALDDA